MIVRIAGIILFFFLMLSCDGASLGRANERTKVNENVGAFATQQYCFGRLILDLPSDFELTSASSSILGHVFSVLQPGSKADFDRLIVQRRNQIMALPSPVRIPNALFADIPHANGHIFGFAADNVSYDVGGGELEVYAHSGGTIFVSKSTALQENGQLQFLDQDFYVIERIAPRAEGEIPTRPAFCFEGGMVQTERVESERVSFRFSATDLESTNLSGSVDTSQTIRRYESPYSAAPPSVTVNNRRILGLDGQEASSFLTQTADGNDGFFFTARAPVRGMRDSSPKIRLEFKQFSRPSMQAYEQTDIKAQWDYILNAMRFTSGI